jgi:hypothetical protein
MNCLWSYLKLGLIQIIATLLRHVYHLKYNYSNQRASMWSQEYSFSWQMTVIKAWEMSFIPTQSDACMSFSWLLGNAESCKGETVSSWCSKIGTSQRREITPTENICPPGLVGVGRRVNNPTNKTKTNSGALVRQRTIPTERLPLVGEVGVNFSG